MQADAPELISVLKQHGILEQVALLEHEGDVCEVVTGASKFSALSLVSPQGFREREKSLMYLMKRECGDQLAPVCCSIRNR